VKGEELTEAPWKGSRASLNFDFNNIGGEAFLFASCGRLYSIGNANELELSYLGLRNDYFSPFVFPLFQQLIWLYFAS
jgi:hypothetical protein